VLGIVSLVGFSVVYAAARDGCRGPPR
jgi:hypothetical protein